MSRAFSAGQRRLLVWVTAGRCAICSARLTNRFHADHRKPYSRGGKTTTDNGQALCADCNLKKGAQWT